MKKICFLLLLAFTASSCFSQVSTSPQIQSEFLEKSKNQKTAAWVLLGGGFVVTVAGISIAQNHLWDETFYGAENTKGTGALITGLALMAGSVPLFIASGRNRRKAFSISMKNEKMHYTYKNTPVQSAIPSLSISMNF